MPVIIGQVDTEISMGGGSAPAPGGGAAPSGGAPVEVQVEELRDTIREIIAEELERQLRRRMPER
jgi:hypothetical protein